MGAVRATCPPSRLPARFAQRVSPTSPFRFGQLFPNILPLRKAVRSSGIAYRTTDAPLPTRDADDPHPPARYEAGSETRGPHSRGRRSRRRALRGRADIHGRRRGPRSRGGGPERQVRSRQARCDRRRSPRRGQGRRRQERHDDDRDRARSDREGRRPAGHGRLCGPYLRQARLRPGHRAHRQGRLGHRGSHEALLGARHRPARGDPPGRPRRGHQGVEGRRGVLPGAGQEDPGREPVQPVLRDGRRRLRRGPPEGGRPWHHHRHPRLRRRPRPPRAAEDHDRRAQDRRLGHRHRPAGRQRPHLAPDGDLRLRAHLHLRRQDLDRAGRFLPGQHLPGVVHHGGRRGGRRQPRR